MRSACEVIMEEKNNLNEEKMSEVSAEKKVKNYWKLVCILLLSLFAIFLTTVVIMISTLPEPLMQTSETENYAEGVPIAFVTLQRDGINRLIYHAIPDLQQNNLEISIVLEDEVIISGSYEVFGFHVPFSVNMMATALPDGNILLETHVMYLGQFELPAYILLALIAESITLPDYVYIQGENILIRLDQIRVNHIRVHANDLDLARDVAVFELYLVGDDYGS